MVKLLYEHTSLFFTRRKNCGVGNVCNKRRCLGNRHSRGGGRSAAAEHKPCAGTLLIFSSSLAAVLTLALATIHYRITDTHIRLNVFFVDVLSGRIRLDNVLNVVKKQDKLYISYLWKGEDPVIAQIAVKPKYFDKIKNAITSANPKVRYYDETEDSSGDQ